MSSLLGILVCCVLVATASAIQAQDAEINAASLKSQTELRLPRAAKRPSCIILIPEDEANGLTKLLNGFLNVFAKTDPAAVDFSPDAGSSFVLNCDNGISGLETSVWRILNRVWLATSCQYSEQEFDQALLEVEREADKVLITLKNVDVVPFNGRIKIDYYHNTVATIKTTLVQTVEKMKEVQNSGRCHSSAVKQLTANFEEALLEIKSQKETIAVLQKETRQALSDIKILKAQTEKSLLAVTAQNEETEVLLLTVTRQKNETEKALGTMKRQKDASNRELETATRQNEAMKEALKEMRMQKEETESALRKLEAQKKEMEGALEMMRTQTGRTDSALADVATQKTSTATALQAIQSQGERFEDLRSVFNNQTLKREEAFSALESAGGRFRKDIEELKTKNSAVEETLKTRESEFADYKTKMSQVAGKQAEKDSEQDELLEKLNAKVFSVELNSTKAPVPEETSTAAPPTALQVYRSSGLAGLTGKPLNIENEHYKGEFLYLARNPTDRSASVYFYDGATLAVGGDKLRQKAFEWEFVRVPGEDSSVVYLRNKLNVLKPMASKEDEYGRWNYIRIETVSSSTVELRELGFYYCLRCRFTDNIIYNGFLKLPHLEVLRFSDIFRHMDPDTSINFSSEGLLALERKLDVLEYSEFHVLQKWPVKSDATISTR